MSDKILIHINMMLKQPIPDVYRAYDDGYNQGMLDALRLSCLPHAVLKMQSGVIICTTDDKVSQEAVE